jgi:hypothetical protein
VLSEALSQEYDRAHDEYRRAVTALVPLLVRMALESIAEVLPGAHRLEVLGEVNEDSMPTLRVQRALNGSGDVLFDVTIGDADRSVEARIDAVNVEYLDPLLDLTGDDYLGAKTINITSVKS